ncbi:hypothetical protein M6D81_13915 [Paenibacillus sp. J5C_2022]|uniref:TOTE conflict system archaeo-eukaryotic primase domain-containing protein n=1 Tax=Paenibacillus sp. J5C2022 TaxID=2977129 RepID=UPI0021CECF31|nr:hypothetical protein [Paenibacillus sp. J5C2022]MCU6709789.1 hypothetical protein [Paenibacillus sp. J5C2022]
MIAIDRLYDLYIIQSRHYIVGTTAGKYRTVSRGLPLHRSLMSEHLNGGKPVGTFSGQFFTKFICFDVDYRDHDMAKWAVYKLNAALLDSKIDNHVTSFSGEKGYHVEVFFEKPISTDKARAFYEYILKQADIDDIPSEAGVVEFRPTAKQAVKLPMCNHGVTGKYAGFCQIDDGLKPMDEAESKEYLMSIKKTDPAIVYDALREMTADPPYTMKDAAQMEDVIAGHKLLESHRQDESYTLERASRLFSEGMTGPGQRHKSFIILARLFNHNGADIAVAEAAILSWLDRQDKSFYRTERAAVEKDLQEVLTWVYENNKTLTTQLKDLTVSFGEVDAIMRRCKTKGEKAVMYAILVHSKRWTEGDGQAFYMTYKQMAESAGVSSDTVWRVIEKLEAAELLEIVGRNRAAGGTYKKLPNVYRVKLESEGQAYAIEPNSTLEDIIADVYRDSKDRLRRILPRRQFDHYIKTI